MMNTATGLVDKVLYGQNHTNQVREGMRTHFMHNAGAVYLYSTLADLQLDGDHLVGLATDHALHDLGLTGRQALYTTNDFLFFVQALALLLILLQDGLYFFKQGLFPVGLLDEVYSAFFHGVYRHGNVTMAGHENDREDGVLFVQFLLQLHTVHTRHADIQHNAAGHLVRVILKKSVGAFVRLYRLAIGFQQQLQRVTDGFVIFDYVHGLLDISHGSVFSCPFYYGPDQWMDGSLCSSRACSWRSCSRIVSSRC